MDILLAVAALVIGAVAGFFLGKRSGDNQAAALEAAAEARAMEIEQRAEQVLAKADQEAERRLERADKRNEEIKQRKIKENKERVAKAKREAAELRSQAKQDLQSREDEVRKLESGFQARQDELKSQQSALDKQRAEFETERKVVAEERRAIEQKRAVLEEREGELQRANDEHIRALERVAGVSEAEAREQILQAVREKADTDAMALVKASVEEAKNNAATQAKKIIVQAIQRQASATTIENTVSVFKIPSDEIKGQIIGREGRNIRAIETATGAELVVDDTPEVITISSFDPVRREVCRLALKQLVADRRIQPTRIEEVVSKVRKELEAQIAEIGEKTVIELDIHGLAPYLVKMVGRMRFRSSYGQNLLRHSIETANLCATMAAEVGLNRKQIQLAKRAGLLHDIGKVVEEETELTHAIIGMQLAEKHGEHAAVINAIGAHHDEIEMTNILSPIIQACDAISGARPGARREILESYLERIQELEDIAMKQRGVEKAFAMQAGRELRVMVEADKVSDAEADDISFRISQKIQEEMQYPGQIKVTVIREKRAVTFAR